MPFQRPTLTQLIQQMASDIASAIPGADALLRFSNFNIIGKVLTGLAHLHYGYQDWISKQAVPFTATDEFLSGWAALKGITAKPAAKATGFVLFTGGETGVEIAGEIPIVRADGTEYIVTAGALVDGSGNCTVGVTATNPGADGNCDAGVAMTLGVAIAGIQSTGAVTTGGLTGGADPETDAELRTRMLAAYANPPQGGAAGDYVNWALEVPGVTRAWCRPAGNGPGTVVVYFMEDDAEIAHGGFPQGSNGVATAETRASAATGDQLIVANFIYPLQSVPALVYSNAPTNHAVAVTISGISGVSVDTKAAITAALKDVFFRTGSPGGVYMADDRVAGTIDLSDLESAIASVPGTAGFVITVPADNVTSAVGALPTLGAVTYI